MTVDDKRLSEQFAGGEEGAFEELVRRHLPRVRSLAINMLGDGHAADDVVQQVFLRVYKQGTELAKVEHFRAWLHRVTINRCYTLLRRKGGRPDPLPIDHVVAGLLAGPDSTVEAAERGERVEQLREALDSIPAPQRAVLAMHYQEGLTYVEIAERMDTTVNTIKSRFRRAKERLRNKLKHLYPESIR